MLAQPLSPPFRGPVHQRIGRINRIAEYVQHSSVGGNTMAGIVVGLVDPAAADSVFVELPSGRSDNLPCRTITKSIRGPDESIRNDS